MSVTVRIPTPLQKLTKEQSEVSANGATVSEILSNLDAEFSGLKDKLYDDKGQLRRFINFYVNDEDIRFLDGEETKMKDGDELSIVPAIAGGA